MKPRLRIPIRFKFMLTLLVLVTGVVSFITFSTASLFREDKETYINGLTSMVALSTAEEARSLLTGYRERLQLYARIMLESPMSRAEKVELSRTLFEDFPELLAVTLHPPGGEPAAVYNVAALEAGGLDKTQLRDHEAAHPLPLDRLRQGQAFVRNTTLSDTLPCFTLAFGQPSSEDAQPAVVSAAIRLDRLLGLTSRFSAYEVLLVDSEGTFLAHSDPGRVARREPAGLGPDVEAVRDGHSAGLTVRYELDGHAMIGGFASAGVADVIAGAQIPESAAHLGSKKLVRRLLIVAAVLLALATLIGFLWAHRITRPVESLSAATRTVARGEFDVKVETRATDEIGDLASSFNQMAHELAVRESALQEAQSQLIQSEKLAAFGQLGAGIAHEVKNPLAGILACAQIALTEVEEQSQVHDDLRLIEKETKRCKTIIENLLRFARQEKSIMEPVQINGVVEDAVAIVNHQLELNKVKLEKELTGGLPPILGNANQLQQVLMNLLINAQQAMQGEPGTITVVTARSASGQIEVRVRDTGPGMSEEVRQRLFEPFFTTKPNGQGTGLGLSVSFGIIKDHAGTIVCDSAPGQGTIFTIALPALEEQRSREEGLTA